MTKVIWSALLLAAAAWCDGLPVTDVVLYKNGIGYFVRGGVLKPGETAGLHFKAGEMNDVLKSLTIAEDGGGKVSGLRYDSSEPLEMKLALFPFKVGERQPLSTLLDQLRGARLELKTGSEAVAGLVVSAREAAGGDKRPQREEVTLLLDSGELRTLDLAGITAVRFTDASVQGQLKQYLGDVAAGRSKEKRSVYIDSSGEKERKLTASYVVPAPIWKSSYRLVFTDAAEPTFEGWAIVDNTTGEDWSKVRLALVSGRPVSFVSNLYEPHYVRRRTMDVLDTESARPEIHAGAVGGATGGLLDKAAQAPPLAAPRAEAARVMGKQDLRRIESSVAAPAETAERGELFEYRFGEPVSVRSGESAMLPFLQQKISARKLLIYSNTASQNPRNAAELTNTTGKTLDGGPVTVFDGGAYAGEALVETVKAGDRRLISYAVDLGTRIATGLDSTRDLVREVHVRRGVLTARSALQETTTYTIRNVDQKAKALVVEHAIRPEYKLIGPKAAETTAAAYRFEIKLGPEATSKLPVTEERVYDQTIALASATPDFLLVYVQNKSLNEAARKQIGRIAANKSLVAANEGEIRRTVEQIDEIVRDQERLRQNIMSLNRVSGQQEQVQKYAAQLASQETQLASLRDRQSELRKKKTGLEGELNQLIDTVEF